MLEKLKTAKNLRSSCKKITKNREHQKMLFKCYRAYVFQCIIKRSYYFQVLFKDTYVDSFSKRVKDWLNYALKQIYRFILLLFISDINPKSSKSYKIYDLIHYGVPKPIHLTEFKEPDEVILNYFLEKNGFKVKTKYFNLKSCVYCITEI